MRNLSYSLVFCTGRVLPLMRIFVASDTGIVKAIVPERASIVNISSAASSREFESDCMCWTRARFGFFVAHKHGIVRSYLAADQSGSSLPALAQEYNFGERLAGIHAPQQSSNNNTIDFIGCSTTGNVKGFAGAEKVALNFAVGGKISCMQIEASDKFMACGGEETELRVFDLQKNGAQKWAAKNVADDEYSLRRPVWVRGVRFFPSNSEKLVIGTGYGQIRIYDQRTQRRPTLDVTVSKKPITCIDLASDENLLYTGDTVGNICHFDLRLSGRLLGAFKGTGGSVRALQLHASEPYLASCGLDRFVRVHNLKSRKLAFKVYAKQAQSALLFDPTVPFEHIEAKQEEQEEVEEDIKAKSSATKVTKKAKKDEEPAAAKANLKKKKVEEEEEEEEEDDDAEGEANSDDGEEGGESESDEGSSGDEGEDDEVVSDVSDVSDASDDDDEPPPRAETAKRKRSVVVLRGGQGGGRTRGRGRRGR